jgi:uncharacterized protein YndB with AHSA1/START domain
MDREAVLAQPLAVVFRFFTSPLRLPAWLPEVTGVQAGDTAPDQAGAVFLLTVRADGQETAGQGELIAYEPPWSAAYRLLAGPHTYVLRLTCTATSGGATRVRIHQGGSGARLTVDLTSLTSLADDGRAP